MVTEAQFASLRELAHAHGVETAYRDMNGRVQEAEVESLLAILQVMDVPLHSLNDIPAALADHHRSLWRRSIEPVLVAWDGYLEGVKLRLPLEYRGGPVTYELFLESGETISHTCDIDALHTDEIREVEGQRYVLKSLSLAAPLPFGYHRIRIDLGKQISEALVICSPSRAYHADEKPRRRFWGLFVPMYSLHSGRSFDGGDFSDLRELIDWVCRLGGSVVATLPFLASFLDDPFDPSPYAPVSRLFWNEFYIDVTAVPELEQCPTARGILESSAFRREIEEIRSMSLVDYRRQMALKRRILEELTACLFGDSSSRRADFERFLESSPRLEDYAKFRACCEHSRRPWAKWPEPMREGRLGEDDYSQNAKRYHEYVQWVAHQQLNELSGIACNGGLGLYLDLPLGVHPDGYDVWKVNGVFAKRVATGAPPDVIFTGGQNWGFPPLHPEAIRRQGYRYVIDYLRHHMSLAGVLRVDHVMGLHHLFWIPHGMSAADGVYVQYSADELYAIFCLESHRNKCLVVGENLGTVPPYVNEAMEAHGLHTMYVTQYELTHEPEHALNDTPAGAVASLNTHDMPPFAAYWQGLDIEDRVKLGFLDESTARGEIENRRGLKEALVAFLRTRGWLAEGPVGCGQVLRGCLSFLAAGKARIVLANLEDLWEETASQNIPGTIKEHPNWRRKARFGFDEFSHMPEVVEFLGRIDGLVRGQPDSDSPE